MTKIMKKYLFTAIAFVLGILIALGSVIFQNFTHGEQISIFKTILIILFILVLILIIYTLYFKITSIKWKISKKYKDWIGIEGRIKREISQIKQRYDALISKIVKSLRKQLRTV